MTWLDERLQCAVRFMPDRLQIPILAMMACGQRGSFPCYKPFQSCCQLSLKALAIQTSCRFQNDSHQSWCNWQLRVRSYLWSLLKITLYCKYAENIVFAENIVENPSCSTNDACLPFLKWTVLMFRNHCQIKQKLVAESFRDNILVVISLFSHFVASFL